MTKTMPLHIWLHLLRAARGFRKSVMAEVRYQPKPSIRHCVECAWDGVNEYHQG